MKRFMAFLLGGICAALILVAWQQEIPSISPILKKFELRTGDYRMKFAKRLNISDKIKIILVKDPNNLSEKLAALTKVMASDAGKSFKPKVIGFNYLFDAPVVNEEFVTAASIAHNVYYAYHFSLTSDNTATPAPNNDIVPFRFEITDVGDSLQSVMEAKDVQLPSQKYLTTARGIGFVNIHTTLDGVYRKIPAFLKFQGNWYGSFALMIALEYLNVQSVDVTFYPGQYIEIGKDDGSFMRVPVSQYGEMLVDFAYDPASKDLAPFQTFSLEDDILSRIDQTGQITEVGALADLKDAIVLVGSPSEVVPIPISGAYPLIGIHANMVNNIITNQFVTEFRKEFEVGLIVFAGLLTGLLLGSHRFLTKILFALLLAAIYLGAAYGVFFQFRMLLPVTPVLLTIGLTFLLVSLAIHPAGKKSSRRISVSPQSSPSKEKKRKAKDAADDLPAIEKQLTEIREELDRKSFRLRSKIEELRLLQEQGDGENYDYTQQTASLQKEIRAREIEIKGLLAQEEDLRRQIENLPSADFAIAQGKHADEKVARFFEKQGFITKNERLLHSLARLHRLSKSSVAILLQGESGAGKRTLAEIVQVISTRHNRPLLEVICAGDMDLLEDDLFGHKKGAFPNADEMRIGLFRKVDGGTLVLEEIGKLSMELQTRLIQTLRGKAVRPLGDDHGYPIDVRVIATTSENLKELVSAGKFREDLYHYFCIFPLYIPSLRERKEDIPDLARHFVKKHNLTHGKVVETLSDNAIKRLIAHDWDGNIAELENVIERAIAEINPGTKELTEDDLTLEQADLRGGIQESGVLNSLIALLDSTKPLPDYQQFRENVLVEIQRMYCMRLLRLHNGDLKAAALEIGLKPDALKKMLTELTIDPDNYRD